MRFCNKHDGSDIAGNDTKSLKIKRTILIIWKPFQNTFFSAGKPLLLASYQGAYKVAKSKKPHVIAEELIKPWRKNCQQWLGQEARKKLELAPVSNNVMQSRIHDIVRIIWVKLSQISNLVL